MIEFLPSEDYGVLSKLDKVCFPIDVPAEYDTAFWHVGWGEAGNPVAFCGWKYLNFGSEFGRVGFLYRAGVTDGYRGQGLQTEMIRLRESELSKVGIKTVVTYTDADGAASMKNLIRSGYLPYVPNVVTRLSGPPERLGRVGFVHWMKNL